jgi:hypothetical protein
MLPSRHFCVQRCVLTNGCNNVRGLKEGIRQQRVYDKFNGQDGVGRISPFIILTSYSDCAQSLWEFENTALTLKVPCTCKEYLFFKILLQFNDLSCEGKHMVYVSK